MLVPSAKADLAAQSFGFQWHARASGAFETDTLYGLTKEQELSAFFNAYGIGPSDLKGKMFLDAGCGDGTLLELISGYGAEIVGMDINTSITIAYRRCRLLPDVVILQGDVFRPCFQPESFDFVWCEGVVVHTPDPEKAFRSLRQLVKPGGRLYLWVYPSERLSIYQRIRDVLLKPYLLPRRALVALCYLLGVATLPAFRITGRKRSLRTIAFDFFDNLSPRYQWRYKEEEIRRWFSEVPFVDLRVTGRIGMSGRRRPENNHDDK
jgi:SAM-dependent methyltransferase